MNIFSYVARQYWKFRVRLASGTLSRLDSSMKKAGMTRTERRQYWRDFIKSNNHIIPISGGDA